MKNLLTSEQMHAADAYTIKETPIAAIELIEAASTAFVNVFAEEVPDKETAIAVLCGKGNNGADGLAIARLLKDSGYTKISVHLILFSTKQTDGYKINLGRLEDLWFPINKITAAGGVRDLKADVVIDAILGSGLNKPLTGQYLELVNLLNELERKVYAVDVPTGFPSEGPISANNVCIKTDLVICFERPKLTFFFPESAAALRRFCVVPIGVDQHFIESVASSYHLVDSAAITELIAPRKIFTHKGTYGHALIVAGQQDTMGAALLAAMSCLHSGAGLTTVSIPETGLTALNSLLPEVMYLNRESLADIKAEKYKSIGVGPGLGTDKESVKLLERLIQLQHPLIIDADALNILSDRKDLLEDLPADSVLTPHMKEFDHLFGAHESWWDRLQTARSKAKELSCIIILKNQYTFIVNQEGNVYINPTGNPAMAQGGMGDVLTGMVCSFVAQAYTSLEAAYIACYLHGMTGDELAAHSVSVTASDLAKHLSITLKGLIK